MKKQIMALVVIMILVLSMTACGSDTKESSGSDSKSTESTASGSTPDETSVPEAADIDLSEQQTISVWRFADEGVTIEDVEENPVNVYWQNKFNINIEYQFPPVGSESEQLSLMLGTGDYTDLFDVSYLQDDLGTLHDDGVIQDLAPYIETYMPNYDAFLKDEANKDIRAAVYDDKGRLFTFATLEEEPMAWGGLVYRRDILEEMTNGNVKFPSGENQPTTVEDWDYMLPLMKEYFENAGLQEYAPLIIPANGYWGSGEVMSGFGIGGTDYIDDSGKVQYGIASDAFYNYLVKMKEWYSTGYVYKDFASRTQDLPYFPNTSLVYSGAAGVYYGLTAHLGTALSVPEQGLEVQVDPIAAPADTDNGVTDPLGIYLYSGRATGGWAVTSACSEEKLIRMMTALDYFYSEDGAAVRTMGLSTAEGAAEDAMLLEKGFTEGTRKPNSREWTVEMNANTEDVNTYSGGRLPGLKIVLPPRESDIVDGVYVAEAGAQAWSKYGHDNCYPFGAKLTSEEAKEANTISTNIQDYANSMIPKFISGQEELSEASFQKYLDQLNSLGLETYLKHKTTAYERYLERTK